MFRIAATILCFSLAAVALSGMEAQAQDDEKTAKPYDLIVTVDGGRLNIPEVFSVYNGDTKKREPIDTVALSQLYFKYSEEIGVDIQELTEDEQQKIEAGLAKVEVFNQLFTLVEEGGMQGIQAHELLALIFGGAQCIADGGQLLSTTYLIRSEMDLYYSPATEGAQIDIKSLKWQICIKPGPSISPIIIDRRWVVNVANGNLQINAPATGPNGTSYAMQFHAQGTSISLLGFYVDGVLQPASTWNYDQNASSCIDIFFTSVPPQDGPVLVSTPGSLLFCAGGACRQQPPGLDATH